MDDLESFRARYPFDDDAYNYIVNSSLEVQQEVLRDFKPKQEGEEDYSALVMGFTKRRRQLDKERRMHGGYAPPNQMMPDHGNGSIHDELQVFLDRYPVDEEAQRFLNTCPPHVQRIIFQTFKPKREGEADYSALLISFAKRVRQSQPKAAPFMDFAAPYEHIVPPRDLRPAGGGSGYGRVQGVNYEAFRARYPFDDAAHNYLQKLPPDVRIHVLQNFKPPQEGESDYSALVISYCKKTREAMHPPMHQPMHHPMHQPMQPMHQVPQGYQGRPSLPQRAPWSQPDPAPVAPRGLMGASDSNANIYALEGFRQRYPMDDRAFDFLKCAPAFVQQQVLEHFNPQRKDEADYSALIISFAKKCREREQANFAAKRPRMF